MLHVGIIALIVVLTLGALGGIIYGIIVATRSSSEDSASEDGPEVKVVCNDVGDFTETILEFPSTDRDIVPLVGAADDGQSFIALEFGEENTDFQYSVYNYIESKWVLSEFIKPDSLPSGYKLHQAVALTDGLAFMGASTSDPENPMQTTGHVMIAERRDDSGNYFDIPPAIDIPVPGAPFLCVPDRNKGGVVVLVVGDPSLTVYHITQVDDEWVAQLLDIDFVPMAIATSDNHLYVLEVPELKVGDNQVVSLYQFPRIEGSSLWNMGAGSKVAADIEVNARIPIMLNITSDGKFMALSSPHTDIGELKEAGQLVFGSRENTTIAFNTENLVQPGEAVAGSLFSGGATTFYSNKIMCCVGMAGPGLVPSFYIYDLSDGKATYVKTLNSTVPVEYAYNISVTPIATRGTDDVKEVHITYIQSYAQDLQWQPDGRNYSINLIAPCT